VQFKIKPSRLILVVCAACLCMNLWIVETGILHAGQILLAEMVQTEDSVNYGAGSADGIDSSEQEEPGQSGPQGSDDYTEYQAGPTRAQVEQTRRQELDKEAASLDMLQNLFIGLDARPRVGPLEDRGLR